MKLIVTFNQCTNFVKKLQPKISKKICDKRQQHLHY